MSFDVVPLFTNIPTDIVLWNIIENWSDIKEATNINLDLFLQIVKSCYDSCGYLIFPDSSVHRDGGLAKTIRIWPDMWHDHIYDPHLQFTVGRAVYTAILGHLHNTPLALITKYMLVIVAQRLHASTELPLIHPTSIRINITSNYINWVITLTITKNWNQLKQPIYQHLCWNNYPSAPINRTLHHITPRKQQNPQIAPPPSEGSTTATFFEHNALTNSQRSTTQHSKTP